MELKQQEQIRTTTQYWGYRELAPDELDIVGGGYDGDCGPGCGAPGGSGGDAGGGDSVGTLGEVTVTAQAEPSEPSASQITSAVGQAIGVAAAVVGIAITGTNPIGAVIGLVGAFGMALSTATNPGMGGSGAGSGEMSMGNPMGDYGGSGP